MNADFQFRSFKIDRFEYDFSKRVDLLDANIAFSDQEAKLDIGVRKPHYFVKSELYVGGLNLKLKIHPKRDARDDSDSNLPEEEAERDDRILSLTLGIAGTFRAEKGRLEEETELKLVKYHIPALLFPYARGAITSFLSNAGFSSFILPLMNIHAISEKVLQNVQVEVVEETS